ncbi:MAG TPA: hypothetical protein VHK44_04795 [Xanthobacteraceae bacterium]|nr:hypothetical protein [Xanthobacteraceae bacterium]
MLDLILLCRDQSVQEDFRATPRQIGDEMGDPNFPAFWPPRHVRLFPASARVGRRKSTVAQSTIIIGRGAFHAGSPFFLLAET